MLNKIVLTRFNIFIIYIKSILATIFRITMIKKILYNESFSKGYIFSFDKENFILSCNSYSIIEMRINGEIRKSIIIHNEKNILIELDNIEDYLFEKYKDNNINVLIIDDLKYDKNKFISLIRNL